MEAFEKSNHSGGASLAEDSQTSTIEIQGDERSGRNRGGEKSRQYNYFP